MLIIIINHTHTYKIIRNHQYINIIMNQIVPRDSIRDLLIPQLEVTYIALERVTQKPSQKGHQQNCQVYTYQPNIKLCSS